MSLRNFFDVRLPLLWVAIFSLVLQPAHLFAAPAVTASANVPAVPSQAATPFAVSTADIALQSGGVLSGQILSSTGMPLVGSTVELLSGQQTWQTRTDAAGRFQLGKLRGGTYRLNAAGQTQLLRAWAAGSAPPHARHGILVLPETEVVRGQRSVSPRTNQFFRVAKRGLSNPWVVTGIVATAVAIPVGIHNADDDAPPASP